MNTALPFTAESNSASDVYLSVAGQQLGPFCLPRALAVVRRNRLEARGWLWRSGMTGWTRIADYLHMRSIFGQKQ
jgi:hypothetical protein